MNGQEHKTGKGCVRLGAPLSSLSSVPASTDQSVMAERGPFAALRFAGVS
jgi:hypothetical protein